MFEEITNKCEISVDFVLNKQAIRGDYKLQEYSIVYYEKTLYIKYYKDDKLYTDCYPWHIIERINIIEYF